MPQLEHCSFILNTKISEEIDSLSKLLISGNQRAALSSMEELRCVEAQHRDVAEVCDWLIVDPGCQGMGRIVEDAQSKFLGDGLQRSDSAGQTIDVNAENPRGAGCHQAFNRDRIDRHGHWIDVRENWSDPAPSERVRCRRECEWRCNDLSRQIQRLAGGHKRHCAIVEERHVRRLEIGAQEMLKLASKGTRVGQLS
jgi:hypothetical protein